MILKKKIIALVNNIQHKNTIIEFFLSTDFDLMIIDNILNLNAPLLNPLPYLMLIDEDFLNSEFIKVYIDNHNISAIFILKNSDNQYLIKLSDELRAQIMPANFSRSDLFERYNKVSKIKAQLLINPKKRKLSQRHFDLLLQPVIVIDENFQISYVNKYARDSYHLKNENLVGINADEIISDLKNFFFKNLEGKELYDTFLNFQGELDEIETLRIQSDINTLQLSLSNIIVNGKKEPIVIIKDEGEAKNKAEQLQIKSEQLLINRNINNSGFWMWDIVHSSLIINNEIYELLECRDYRLFSIDSLFININKTNKALIYNEMKKSISNKSEFLIDFEVNLPDKKTKVLRTFARPRLSPTGEIISYLGIVQDVTNLIEFEANIKKQNTLMDNTAYISEKLLNADNQNLMQTLQFAFSRINKDFNAQKSIILRYNNKNNLQKFLVCSNESLINVYDGILSAELSQELISIVKSSGNINKEDVIICYDKLSNIPEELTSLRAYFINQHIKSMILVSLVASGQFIGFSVLINYSEESAFKGIPKLQLKTLHRIVAATIVRTEYEKKLINAKVEAENANRAKSIFLSNMNHQIRTPLNTLIGYSNLLRESNPSLNNNLYLNGIIEASQNLGNLISDILDLP